MKRINTIFMCLLLSIGVQAQQQNNIKNEYDIYNDGKHKGLDFSLKTGVLAGVGDAKGSNFIPIELSLGKQFHPNLYLGIGSGAWIGTKGNSQTIPITADSKVMFPLQSSKLKPIISFRLGYLISLGDGNQTYEDDWGNEHEISYETPNSIIMEFMPGIQFPLSKTTDFMLSAGYTHGFVTEGSGSSGYFSVKAGFNFHKNPYKIKKGPKREKVATRSKGIQFTFEGEGNYSYDFRGGGNLICTYKLNPYFSIGGGIGYGRISFGRYSDDIQVIRIYEPKKNGVPEQYTYEGSLDPGAKTTSFKFFARATYRPINRRLSPVASVDFGAYSISMSNPSLSIAYTSTYSEGNDAYKNFSTLKVFATPSIGLSLRTTKNSYIELKAGYNFNSKLQGKKKHFDSYSYTYYVSARDKSLSSYMISLGFTHTFGKRGKRLR